MSPHDNGIPSSQNVRDTFVHTLNDTRWVRPKGAQTDGCNQRGPVVVLSLGAMLLRGYSTPGQSSGRDGLKKPRG
jgi:hypothetical protein